MKVCSKDKVSRVSNKYFDDQKLRNEEISPFRIKKKDKKQRNTANVGVTQFFVKEGKCCVVSGSEER